MTNAPKPLLHRVFSPREKHEMMGEVFCDIALDQVDFAGADLRGARFENVSLRQSDFSGADLRSTDFHHCDLRGAIFDGAALGDSRFERSCLADAVGLTEMQRDDVCRGGGTFVDWGKLLQTNRS